MSSSQGAICSLVFSTSSVVTASSLGHVFARPCKSRSKSMPHQHTKSTDKDQKGPLERFRLFGSKTKRPWKTSSLGHIFPPTTIFPLVVLPELITIDDDASSICSDATSLFLGGLERRNSSVPNLPGQTSWDNSPSLSVNGFGYKHRSLQTETLHEEDEDAMEQDQNQKDKEEEVIDWDSQSGNGCLETSPSRKRASLPTPISIPVPNRRHRRAMSLPQSSIQDLPQSMYERQPTPSETWDDDFDLDTNEVNVPPLVEEAQIFIRMDMSNIRDFTTQIEELKTLRENKKALTVQMKSRATRIWSNGFPRKSLKQLKQLEETYKTDWEEADVIIYVSDVAQDQEPIFNGGKSLELGINGMPSERHLKVLRKIINEQLADDDIWPPQFGDFPEEEENKENIGKNFVAADTLCEDPMQQSPDSPKKSIMNGFGFSSFYGLKRNNSGQVNSGFLKKKRRDDVRISVDEMPSLIEYLRKLQRRLTKHLRQLEAMKDL